MNTAAQIRREIAGLAQRAERLLDSSMSMAEKQAEYKGVKAHIEAKASELSRNSDDGNRAGYADLATIGGSTGATAAATVAEGATKLSSPVWTTGTATVRKLAHVASLTDEAQNDFPTFTQFIGDEMLAGLVGDDEIGNPDFAALWFRSPGFITATRLLRPSISCSLTTSS